MEKSLKINFGIFLSRLLAYSIFIYAAIHFTSPKIPAKFQYPHSIYLVAFFFVITAVFHLGMLRNAAKSGGSIIRYFMLATALKFFLYLGIMIGYGLVKPDHAASFISNFFAVYALITVFEVSVIYSHFKSKPSEYRESEAGKNR